MGSDDREALLVGLDPRFLASLPKMTNPAAQLLSDLHVLNRTERLADNSIPLVRWLENAILFAGPRVEGVLFKQVLRDVLVSHGHSVNAAAHASASAPHTGASFLTSPVYQWDRPQAVQLHVVLATAYAGTNRARSLCDTVGIPIVAITSINFEQAPLYVWKEILNIASATAKLSALLDKIRRDESILGYRPEIERLLAELERSP